MPRKGYRSLTLPDELYEELVKKAEMYGTTVPRLIGRMVEVDAFDETFIKKFQGAGSYCASPDDDYHGNCTVQIENLGRFEGWLRLRKQLSERVLRHYMREVSASGPSVTPESFLVYRKWRFLAFRNYVHYLYQMGIMGAEERARWLELLKFKRNNSIEPPDVRECDVRAMMNSTDDPIINILFYSGLRIIEAVYVSNNAIPFEDFGSFRRYEVKWSRGQKRCDYAYIPSFVALKPTEVNLDHFARQFAMNPKLLRKFFYRTAKRTALENRADPLIVDFYQSRVSKFSVGERHYGELRSEADELYPKVVDSLKGVLL